MRAADPADPPGMPPDAADLQRRLDYAEQLLACFQQVVGHELPNHLIAIQGLVRVLELEEGAGLNPESREYLKRLAASAGRVQTLTSAVAEIGRARRDSQKWEVLAPIEVAREAAAEINQLFPEHAIEYHFSEPTLCVLASRPALHRVYVQLLRNAVQAANPGQGVRVDVGTRMTSEAAELWVADHGRGLTPERRQQLQDFLSGSIPLFPGPGLGLVLVRQVLSRWEGSLAVDSEQGRGSVFTIRLPADKIASGTR
jgi:signal transduction histidine kinase